MWAKVLLPLALHEELLYTVPSSFQNQVALGKRVVVELGKRTTYVGIITELFSDESSLSKGDFELKSLLLVWDEQPIVSEEEISFWRFLSFYYLVPLGDILVAALPSSQLPRGTTRVAVDYEALRAYNPEDSRDKAYIRKLVDSKISSLSFSEFVSLLGGGAVTLFDKLRLLDILKDEKLEEVPIAATGVESYTLGKSFQSLDALEDVALSLKRAPAQKQVLMRFVELLPLDDEEKPDLHSSVPVREIYEGDPLRREALRRLQAKLPDLFTLSYLPPRLTHSPVVEELSNAPSYFSSAPLDPHKPTLFWAYDDAEQYAFIASHVKYTLSQGKRVLLLLPQSSSPEGEEIFLRPLLALQKEPIVSLTGQTSQKKRMEIRKLLLETDTPLLIVGSRLATFIPSKDLGLIIVAEEQDGYYKQQEPSPRFHARDSLIFRAQSLQIPFLMTAVTPSLETFYNVKAGKYNLIRQAEKQLPSPNIELIDIKRERQINRLKKDCIITQALQQRIEEVLSNKGKVLLLAARKGFAPFLACSKCGESIRCHRCDVTLTYHRYRNQLICPYCGYSTAVPSVCPHCLQLGEAEQGSLKKKGFGSERIEIELQSYFPQEKIVRVDAETTRNKSDRKRLKEDILSHEANLFVGTTLITRLTTLRDIELIAVPQFDLLASYPDFRNDEQLYSLFVRLSRRFPQAKWVVQMSDIGHPLIESIRKNSLSETYEALLAERDFFHFPPYQRLIRLILKGRNRQELEEAANIYASALCKEKKAFLEVEKPIEPFVSRVKLFYIRHITLRLNSQCSSRFIRDRIREIIRELRKQYLLCRKVNLFFDVDPY